MAEGPPSHTGYAFPGMENLHSDIYPHISAVQTPSLKQKGKVILVTGSSRGIGRAIALQYAYAGVACIILCARSTSQLEEVERDIKMINGSIRVIMFPLDVGSEVDIKKCAREVQSKEGRLDVLINNAGFSAPWVPLAESDPQEWWQTFEVNVKGPYLMLHAFLPLLMSTAKGYGSIPGVINISSIGAHMTNIGASAYQISKLAVLRLTEFVTEEYGAQGVNAFSVHPGGVPTDMALAVPVLKPFLTDTPELCGGFCVWLTAEDRTWLAGRYLSAAWDVGKLESMKLGILESNKLKVRMVV